jgi:hypothetical protein
MRDNFITLDARQALERAGYENRLFGCCKTCRYHADWWEGEIYCLLYVSCIDTRDMYVLFASVRWNGICKHYRLMKLLYRLNGVAAKSLTGIRDEVRRG